ncbi:MAG: serine/threonine-protein kinase, partial [Planctomycetota bacterium]
MPEHKTLGNYEIIERVGSGSMGAVFKARQVSMDRIVALKILPPKLAENEAFVQRFLREAQSAGKLGHGNLIQVIEVGRAGQYYFYSMEFVGGPTLKQVLVDRGPVDSATAIDYMTKIAGALAEAHRRGIVHRDVKPDNIILTDQGEPKLADLGLAKPMSGAADVTMGGAAIGTPHYMSPEQSRGEEVDGRADLYALGATFFRMLTGETLFDGPTATAVMVKHSTEEPRKLREVRPDASSGLEAVLAKLLAKKPGDRYPDAEALIADLEAVGSGKLPKHARIAIDSARLGRARTRRRDIPTGRQERVAAGAEPRKAGSSATTIAAAAAGFLVVLVGGILVFTGGGPESSTEKPKRPAASPRVSPGTGPRKARAGTPSAAEKARGRGKLSAAAYSAAETFARDNPDDFERAVRFFEEVAQTGKGTEHEAKAEARAAELRSAWRKKAREALGEAVREAKALVGKGEYDEALAKLRSVPESLLSQVEADFGNELDAVRREAQGKVDAAVARAGDLIDQSDFDGARKALASVEEIRYSAGRIAARGTIAALEARIEEAEAAKLSAAERVARARLDATLAAFESHVKAGRYAEA